MNKPSVLIFSDWYLPGFKAGGPIKSIAALTNQLGENFNFYIITTDVDFGEKQPYSSVKSNEWVQISDSLQVYYFSKSYLSKENILKVISSITYNVVYLNSFFSFYFSVVPLWLCKSGKITSPVIIAPRGMLGDGALKIKSLKKRSFILASKITGLHSNVCWHATAKSEATEIRNVFGKDVRIKVISNLSNALPLIENDNKRKVKSFLKLVFLSRISSKKNLLYTLEVLANFETPHQIRLDIFGTLEDQDYWHICLAQMKQIPNNILVSFKGEILPENVQSELKLYDFLILNTLNENYGHAIVEALMSGLPVIISDQTPWRNLEFYKAGWDVPLHDKDQLRKVLNRAIEMDNDEYKLWSKGAVKYAKENCVDKDAIELYRKMFSQ